MAVGTATGWGGEEALNAVDGMIGAVNGIDVDQAAGREGGMIDVVDNGDSDWNG